MSYTWTSFGSAVLDLLPVDEGRQGLATYLEQMKRQAVIEIQRLIPAYRKGHETIYHASDFVREGFASHAVMPPQAEIRNAFLVHVIDAKHCRRYEANEFDWSRRMEMVHGKLGANGGQSYIAIDPHAYTFYIYPTVPDCWVVSLFWDGLKLDFADAEEVPFDEQMVEAVAEFVQGKIARKVDRDIPLHDSYMASYMRKRKALFLTAKDRGRINQ